MGDALRASLVIATGGLTVPKIGATPFGYRIAEQFGLAGDPPRPALVPLAFAPDALARYGDLSGISVDADVALRRGPVSREPAVHASRPVGSGDPADLVVLGRAHAARDRPAARHRRRANGCAARATSDARLDNVLAEQLPKRFAQQWCAAHGVAQPLRELGDRNACAASVRN